ncbi:molybdopterin-binding protein [Streptomyces narbonensis]|uniref:Molybdopterin molybdenumtransferase n=1 Tax=Streptomyces narbonensis TaxID=67333 RepID=A0ABV3CAA7_9ACTN
MREWIAAAEAELDGELALERLLGTSGVRSPAPVLATGPAGGPLSWEQGRDRARDSAGQPLPVVGRALDEALGHALAAPLTAPAPVPASDVLLPAGTTVTPVVVALAAAAGHDRLVVHRRPRLELLLLGDEFPWTGPLLASWAAHHGAEVFALRSVARDPGCLRDAVRGSTADVVVTIGDTGTGSGADTGAGAGARLLVDSVAVRPGHHMRLAELPPAAEGPPRFLVGLPGDPTAAVAGAVTLVVPLLRRLGGHTDPAPDSCRTAAVTALPGHPHDTRLLPVRRVAHGVGPVPCDEPARTLRGLARAHGLAVVPPGGVPAGADVEVLVLPGV